MSWNLMATLAGRGAVSTLRHLGLSSSPRAVMPTPRITGGLVPPDDGMLPGWTLHQVQVVRRKQPTLRKKIKRRRIQKLAKRAEKQAALDAGVEPSRDELPSMPMSTEEAASVLRLHCQNREIAVNKRQKCKPWIMGLLIHRYDTGIRDLDELNAGVVSLRHPLTPGQNKVHEYIHANTSPGMEHRFAKKKQKIAREKIRLGYMEEFAKEAWRVWKARKIPMPLDEQRLEGMIQEKPPEFLSLFSRAFAEVEPDGNFDPTRTFPKHNSKEVRKTDTKQQKRPSQKPKQKAQPQKPKTKSSATKAKNKKLSHQTHAALRTLA